MIRPTRCGVCGAEGEVDPAWCRPLSLPSGSFDPFIEGGWQYPDGRWLVGCGQHSEDETLAALRLAQPFLKLVKRFEEEDT